MSNIFDVAAYILEKCGSMSAWKLQKLCYYSQAWALAWTEKPIFPEEFEAWSNGPVCRELFREHKGLFMIKRTDLRKGDSSKLSPDEKDTIDVVLRDYSGMSPYELRELSHSETPYIEARKGLLDGEPSDRVIPKAAIGAFYGGL